MTLDTHEFIRRFLLHVLPRRYTRIRHYGLMAPANVKTKLVLARELLSGDDAAEASGDPPSADETPAPELPACPVCGEVMLRARTIAPEPRCPEGIDSS